MITQDLLNKLSIQAQDAGTEWKLDCPYCGKAYHLYLNKDTAAFKCHHCQEAGGWTKLRREYGGLEGIREPEPKQYQYPTEEYVIACQKKLLGPHGTTAMEYLASRKISSQLALQFKIGLDKRGKPSNDVLCIPIYEDGKPVNIKYRSLPPQEKSFERWKDGKTSLFNGDILKNMKVQDPVYVTEGEIDAISLVSMGFNAVGSTAGAGTIQTEWIDALKRFEKIYLVYDNDQAGNDGAIKFAKRLGAERCYRVKLPSKDANQFLIDGRGKDEFIQCVNDAEEFGVDNVCTSTQAFKDMMKEYDRKVDETAIYPPWPSVKQLTGNFEPGDLVVVSAKEKTGKSTWMLNMALNWAMQGHPVLFYCLEMRPARLMRQSIKCVARKTDEQLTVETLWNGYKKLSEWPIYWGYNYKKVSADLVFNTMREAFKRYGVEVIIFDNLHYLARDIQHQTQEIGYITRNMKLLAEELEIPIILIAQPRRIGRNEVMGIDDLKDSSSIGADADHVIVLYREKTEQGKGADGSFKPETLVRVDASRFHAGGETVIYYDGARALFRELAKVEGKP